MRPDWVTIVLGSETRRPRRSRPATSTPRSSATSTTPAAELGPPAGRRCCASRSRTSRRSPTRRLLPRHVVADAGRARDHGRLGATTHKLKFFENGATRTWSSDARQGLDPTRGVPDLGRRLRGRPRRRAQRLQDAVPGQAAPRRGRRRQPRQLDFKNTQGAGETRIAAAAGVPPGHRRALRGPAGGDLLELRPGPPALRRRHDPPALAQLRRVDGDDHQRPRRRAELWYDDRDIPFLQEDVKDAAEVQAQEARRSRRSSRPATSPTRSSRP
jgi:hypothetical protein